MSTTKNTRVPEYQTPEYISNLFGGICFGIFDWCINTGTDVSHIIPKSRGKIALAPDNVVWQCRKCHREYHQMGASEKMIALLQTRLKFYLEVLNG